MSGEINVEQQQARKAEVILPKPSAGGWLAFYRTNDQFPWNQVYEPHPAPARDTRCCPYPLIPTREAAIEAGKFMLPNGGDLRLIEVNL